MKAFKNFVSGFLNMKSTKENNQNSDILTENIDNSVNTNCNDPSDILNINLDVSISSDNTDLNEDLNDIGEHETYKGTGENESVKDTESVILNLNENVIEIVDDIESKNSEYNDGLLNSLDNNNNNLLYEALHNYIDENLIEASNDVIDLDEFEDLFENLDDIEVDKQNNTKLLLGDDEINFSVTLNETIIISCNLGEHNVDKVNETLINCNEKDTLKHETESEDTQNKTSLDNTIFIKEFEDMSFKTLKAVIPVAIGKSCDANTNINSNINHTNKVSESEIDTLPRTSINPSNTKNSDRNTTKILRAFRKTIQQFQDSKQIQEAEISAVRTDSNTELFEEKILNNNIVKKDSREHTIDEDFENKSIISISSTEDNGDISPHIEKTNTVFEEIDELHKANTENPTNNTNCEPVIDLCSEESDDDDGYNSSDFEFISQSEAELDGFIINFANRDTEPAKNIKSEVYTEEVSEKSVTSQEDFAIAGPSNRPDNYYRYQYIQEINDRTRQNHVAPQGDDYMNLFRGIYDPVLGDLMLLENKSIKTMTSMNAQYEGIGFDMRMRVEESEDEEYKAEAAETARKILCMYPCENRKRRRRF